MLQPGDKMPEFEYAGDDGKQGRLSDSWREGPAWLLWIRHCGCAFFAEAMAELAVSPPADIARVCILQADAAQTARWCADNAGCSTCVPILSARHSRRSATVTRRSATFRNRPNRSSPSTSGSRPHRSRRYDPLHTPRNRYERSAQLATARKRCGGATVGFKTIPTLRLCDSASPEACHTPGYFWFHRRGTCLGNMDIGARVHTRGTLHRSFFLVNPAPRHRTSLLFACARSLSMVIGKSASGFEVGRATRRRQKCASSRPSC